MKKIKLVIWDLDETFWKGTLSEESIDIPDQNINIIKKLTDRGIVNSICSKNDEAKVKKVLNTYKLEKYFVFNSINWEPKGQRIKNLIHNMNLRAENVLFLDDNSSNLKEVEFYCKGIHTRLPKFINGILTHPALKGKPDKNHSRLEQYHLLEHKKKDEIKYSDNKDFLKSSNIRIIFENPLDHLDRLEDLSERSNQINYVKARYNKQDILKFINDSNVEVKCMRVIDNYGDYGIAGFYVLKNKELLDFVFSCRILNMGVPGFIYKYLDKPKLKVKGEVSENYISKVDWINIEKQSKSKNSKIKKSKKILFVGSCDLEQATYYLDNLFSIDREFNYPKGNVMVHGDHSFWLSHQNLKNIYTSNNKIMSMPFMDKSIFQTKIFNDYDNIIYSPSMDYIQGIYQYKKDKRIKIPYGLFWKPLTESKNKEFYVQNNNLSSNFIDWFSKNFIYKGPISSSDFKNNLNKILTKNKKYVLLNQSEVEDSKFPERLKLHKKLNKILKYVVSKKSNVKLMDVTKFVNKQNITSDITHYRRKVYYILAKQIAKIIDKKNIKVRKSKWLLNKLFSKIGKLKKYLFKK